MFCVNRRLVIGGRICTVLLANLVKPPLMSHARRGERRGGGAGRGGEGRVLVVVVGASLMTSS